MKRANEQNAIAVIFIGDSESTRKVVKLKNMDSGDQIEIPLEALEQQLNIYK